MGGGAISDVPHELKTPLTSIKALIKSLKDGNDDVAVYKEYLRDINGEMDRLSFLVKSLITVTRLEELEHRREPVKLCVESESVAKLFTPLFNQKGIKLEVRYSEEIVVSAGKGMLREVLINLIDNAIKYGRDNVRAQARREKAGKVHLSLIDSGIGLYIVRKIIELHGRSISVKSKPNVGTEFLIEFTNCGWHLNLQFIIMVIIHKICVDKSVYRESSKMYTNFHGKCLTVIYWYDNIIYCIVVSIFIFIF